jgi:hypothetical protein
MVLRLQVSTEAGHLIAMSNPLVQPLLISGAIICRSGSKATTALPFVPMAGCHHGIVLLIDFLSRGGIQVLPDHVPTVSHQEAELSEYSPLSAAVRAGVALAALWHGRLSTAAASGATLEQFTWALSVCCVCDTCTL